MCARRTRLAMLNKLLPLSLDACVCDIWSKPHISRWFYWARRPSQQSHRNFPQLSSSANDPLCLSKSQPRNCPTQMHLHTPHGGPPSVNLKRIWWKLFGSAWAPSPTRYSSETSLPPDPQRPIAMLWIFQGGHEIVGATFPAPPEIPAWRGACNWSDSSSRPFFLHCFPSQASTKELPLPRLRWALIDSW